MKHFFLICFIVVLRAISIAQSWTPMNSLPGIPRYGAASTQTSTHGYILGGETSSGRTSDCWSYEPISQVWNQIASYPGEPRSKAISFSYNDIVYYGWGDVNGLVDSLLYSYNPMTNEWTEIPGAPAGINSWSASCFMIDSKAYMVTFNNLVISYDCNSGVWQQHGNFPGPQRSQGSAFALNGVGYFGLGYPFVPPFLNDFWKYDPVNDSWTEIPGGFPGTRRYAAAMTATSDFGYILCGESQESPVFNNDVWRFDPTTETFQQLSNFPANRNYLSCFVLDGTVCAGCGGPGWNTSWWSANLDGFQQPCSTLTGTLQTGLVGYWPFCGNANDESGNGNDGVVNGATLAEDRFGNAGSAYHFDGLSNSINTISQLPTAEISISFWEKIDAFNFSYPIGLGINSSIDEGYGVGIGGVNNNGGILARAQFAYDGQTGFSNTISSEPVLEINEWYHVVFEHANGISKIYINGVLAAQGNNLTFPSFSNIVFGMRSDSLFFFDGSLDDIGIWNRALTAEEIALLYGNFNPEWLGCTVFEACNYNALSSVDDGSCLFIGNPCDDGSANTTNDIIDADCSCAGILVEIGAPHTCGADLVHNPSLTYGSMTDQEGNVYKTIVIGDQEWMAENLNTSIYRNGEAIATNLDATTWASTTTGAWAYSNDNSALQCPYGKLYNWYTCIDERELCPTGWRIPSTSDWFTLIDNLGGQSVAGGKMRSTGSIEDANGLWFAPNVNASNSSGFSGVPAGYRFFGGEYYNTGDLGDYWSSSENGGGSAWYINLVYYYNSAQWDPGNKHYGFSVRCMREATTGLIPGCIDLLACNYNSTATVDDGSCLYQGASCDDANANTYNDIIDASCGCVGTPIELGVEHTCGADFVHNPSLTYGSMTDQEGNVYKTIVIGVQEWMAENLNTSIYRNGEQITTNLTNTEWGGTSTTEIGAWGYYNNEEILSCPNGKLYNWYACVDPRELCPSGWRVPSSGDWSALLNYIDPTSNPSDFVESFFAGTALKSTGTIESGTGLWYEDAGDVASNSSGFSATPGGQRHIFGDYNSLGNYGFWWSSTGYANGVAAYINLLYYTSEVYSGIYDKPYGFSVRCVRDANTGLIPGCTDTFACNYNIDATEEDGSCTFAGDACDDGNAATTNDVLGADCNCTGTVVNCAALEGTLQDGLVGYWPFCGNANDESGNGNDGVVNGATLTEDRFGNAASAYSFDGVDDAIEVASNASLLPNNLTLSCWIKPVSGGHIIRSRFYGYIIYYDPNTNTVTFQLHHADPEQLWTLNSFSAPDWSENEWHLITGTFDGSTNRLFVDGELVSTVPAPTPNLIYASDGLVVFGRDGNTGAGASHFNGMIDDIGIWNRALSSTEIQSLFTGQPVQSIVGCTDPNASNFELQATVNEGCQYTATIFVYNDINGNSSHDTGEPGLANWPVLGNDINGLVWTNSNGYAYLTLNDGIYTFSILNPSNNWEVTTPNTGTVSLGYHCTNQTGAVVSCPNQFFSSISFGLQVIPGEAIVAVGPFQGFADIIHCTDGYESGVYLENIGSQTVSGFMTLSCDPLFTPGADSYFTTPPIETGPGYALWNLEDFLPGEYELLTFHIDGPGVEYLNQSFTFDFDLTLLDPQGNMIYNDGWSVTPIVACAYDPNDLTGYPEGLNAPHEEGYTIEHFIHDDHVVEFRVRFQNTGTLPAEDIDIYIPINPNVWELGSIEPLMRAADMQTICLHDDGSVDLNILEHELPEGVVAEDLLIFSFDDIFLPDSASDPDGSQGYVWFQMKAKHGLDPATELNAQAFIYFEQNPPIATNETYHEIFDCTSFTPMTGDTEWCEGEIMHFDATQPNVDSYLWTLNNQTIGTANELNYPALEGDYELELTTRNRLCDLVNISEVHPLSVVVNPLPAIYQNTSDVYCEGEAILFDAQSNGTIYWENGLSNGTSITASESFEVDVYALSEANCSSDTLTWMITVNALPSNAVDVAGNILTAQDGISWLWTFNGDTLATTQSISAEVGGNYQVTITNESECSALSDIIEITNIFVHSWPTLTAYPNPMKDLARIELPQGTFDVALYDITGSCVRTLSNQQGVATIARESLASGVYQVRIVQGEQSKSLRLVIE